MNQILLTGSRVYGEPKTDSDYDIVVLVTHEELGFLADAAGVDVVEQMNDGEYGSREDQLALKFGNLNVIALTNPHEFQGWVNGTRQCLELLWQKNEKNKNRFPFGDPSLRVSRAEAKAIMVKAVDEAMAYQEPDYQI